MKKKDEYKKCLHHIKKLLNNFIEKCEIILLIKKMSKLLSNFLCVIFPQNDCY